MMFSRSPTGYRLVTHVDWENFSNRNPTSEKQLFPSPRRDDDALLATVPDIPSITPRPRAGTMWTIDEPEVSESAESIESAPESPPTSLDESPSTDKESAGYYYRKYDHFGLARKSVSHRVHPEHYYGRQDEFRIPRKALPCQESTALQIQDEHSQTMLEGSGQVSGRKRSHGKFMEADIDNGAATPLTIAPNVTVPRRLRPFVERVQTHLLSSRSNKPSAHILLSSAQSKLRMIRGKLSD